MTKATEVFEVTRAQLVRWSYDNSCKFTLSLSEGEPELLVCAEPVRTGAGDVGWSIYAHSCRGAAEEAEFRNEQALRDAASGIEGVLEYEAWRVVDMPDIDATYEIGAEELIELGYIAEALELFVASQMRQYDARRLSAADGSVVHGELFDEYRGSMQAVADIRHLIGDIVRIDAYNRSDDVTLG